MAYIRNNSSLTRFLGYNAQRVRLGDEFRDEAWETIRRINDFPLAWHPLGGSIRRCQMQRFPYGLIYEPTDVCIRNPGIGARG